jgi:HPt (histidine-containing phosphotransfer) domain-containing protein
MRRYSGNLTSEKVRPGDPACGHLEQIVMRVCAGQDLEILDADRALFQVGGDFEYLWELVGIIRAACPTLMHNAREAVACGDLMAIERTAHLLSAVAESVSARRTYDAARELELMAQTVGLRCAQEACQKLEEEVIRLTPRLAAFEDALWFAQC